MCSCIFRVSAEGKFRILLCCHLADVFSKMSVVAHVRIKGAYSSPPLQPYYQVACYNEKKSPREFNLCQGFKKTSLSYPSSPDSKLINKYEKKIEIKIHSYYYWKN